MAVADVSPFTRNPRNFSKHRRGSGSGGSDRVVVLRWKTCEFPIAQFEFHFNSGFCDSLKFYRYISFKAPSVCWQHRFYFLVGKSSNLACSWLGALVLVTCLWRKLWKRTLFYGKIIRSIKNQFLVRREYRFSSVASVNLTFHSSGCTSYIFGINVNVWFVLHLATHSSQNGKVGWRRSTLDCRRTSRRHKCQQLALVRVSPFYPISRYCNGLSGKQLAILLFCQCGGLILLKISSFTSLSYIQSSLRVLYTEFLK